MRGAICIITALPKSRGEQVSVPDVRVVCGEYGDWAGIGKGTASYTSYG